MKRNIVLERLKLPPSTLSFLPSFLSPFTVYNHISPLLYFLNIYWSIVSNDRILGVLDGIVIRATISRTRIFEIDFEIIVKLAKTSLKWPMEGFQKTKQD